MSGDKWFVKHDEVLSELITLKGMINVRIADLQVKIYQAQMPPITGTIYHIGKWEAQIEILKELLV